MLSTTFLIFIDT